MATTENITVLFTDLVGSTEMAAAISPSRLLTSCAGSTFLSSSGNRELPGGSEVKNLGDGLMVVFPVASAALPAPSRCSKLCNRDNTETERPLLGAPRGSQRRGGHERGRVDYSRRSRHRGGETLSRADAVRIRISDLVTLGNAGSEKLPRLLLPRITRA